MCKNDILLQNRLQRYYFLRTQPNKLHKNSQNVHTLAVLCNNNIFFLLPLSPSNFFYFIRLPKMSRVNSLVAVRVAALVAFFTTRPVVEVFDLVFFPVTLSLT